MLWHALPALEELQITWEDKRKLEHFVLYRDTINAGLSKLQMYYPWIDTKPVLILALVLHPYYKLDYIKLSWGGAEKQAIITKKVQSLGGIL
ncbi:hypothetical protein F5888DRAFT_1809600 [Russula emetica]|nr:hypothetical protein F5888DRAFT_1809600 [Russula emetica]